MQVRRLTAIFLAALIIAVLALFGSGLLQSDLLSAASVLPILALHSLGRMAIAYILSLIFAIAYGHAAATNKRASIVLLPTLDVLQSVPILGFFPAAIFFLVATFYWYPPLGKELAVIFLIFTSMSWNMAFGVYEALTTIPRDLMEAADGFRVRGWLRFKRLVFPAVVPKLVYNSILSWSNGWFFLVASEIITAGRESIVLPGLGSYMAEAAARADTGSLLLGLVALGLVVLALDVAIWRPAQVWAERFKYESVAQGTPATPALYQMFGWLPTFPRLRGRITAFIERTSARYESVSRAFDRYFRRHERIFKSMKYADLGMFLTILIVLVSVGITGLISLFLKDLPSESSMLPAAALTSFSRLAAAYLIALTWTIPLAVLIARGGILSRILTPVIEVAASIPATALLPLVVALAISAFRSVELAALIISVFSMQWYLLFNLIAGAKAIPSDLRHAAQVFGLKGTSYWRRVLLPAMYPSLITGSITAWGAGWNALIVAEFIPFGGCNPDGSCNVFGLGYLLDRATFGVPYEPALVILSVMSMVVFVLVMNQALWKPLYRRASVKYRIEYA